MATTIRLARHGKKKFAFYHIVVTDSRSPRDGRYIEKIGYYDPHIKPKQANINLDKAVGWLNKGAVPSATVRSLFSSSGVILKKHLLHGVVKGVITTEEADKRFNNWMTENSARQEVKRKKLIREDRDKVEKQLDVEKKARTRKIEKIVAKKKAAEKELIEKIKEEAAATTEAAGATEAAATTEATETTEAAGTTEVTDTTEAIGTAEATETTEAAVTTETPGTTENTEPGQLPDNRETSNAETKE